jgi:transcriptional regulator with XRE-family HTH domain
MEEKTVFGQFILQKRKSLQMTQREFADKLFVTESAVSKWERGLSYPDITMVTPICKILGITEHELITASDDNAGRYIERQAKTLNRMKIGWQWTWMILYGLGIITCFIVNLAVAHTLSWFWIVLASVFMAFTLTNLPQIIGKRSRHKALICISAETVLLIGLLAIIYAYVGNLGLFVYDALPITIFCLPLAWMNLYFWRYLKVNLLIKLGLTFAVISIYNYITNAFVLSVVNKTMLSLPKITATFVNLTGDVNFLYVIIPIILSVAFFIVGLLRKASVKREV